MYIAAGQGQTTPGDKILMSTETSSHFGHLLQVSKKKKLWSLILCNFFMILYMYIAPEQGLTTPGDKILMSTETSSHFGHLLQVSKKKKLWSLILCNFFMILYMYIAPEQGLTTRSGWNFNVNRNILSLWSFVASFKKISLKSDFIPFFSYFIHVYSRRSGAVNHRGQNFDVNRNLLSLCSFALSFKKFS